MSYKKIPLLYFEEKSTIQVTIMKKKIFSNPQGDTSKDVENYNLDCKKLQTENLDRKFVGVNYYF